MERWNAMLRKKLGLGSILLLFSLLLSSCANSGYIKNAQILANKPIKNYTLTSKYLTPLPPRRVIKMPIAFYLPNPVSVYGKIANIKIKGLDFQGSMRDFSVVLGKLGVPCIVGSLAMNKEVSINGFTGTFEQLANSLSKTYGFIFSESKDIVYIKLVDTFSVSLVSLPQSFSKMLINQLGSVGLFYKLTYSPYTQDLVWRGNAKSIYRLSDILQNLIDNYARIDFDIIIFESTANNLNEFGIGLSNTKKQGNSFNIIGGSGSTNTLSGYFNAGISTETFEGLLHLLYERNKGSVLQKVFLSTTNFGEGELNEGNKIPYVESVTQTFVNDTTNETTPEYSVTFNDALSGISMNIIPTYIKDLNDVYAKINIQIQDVIKMVNVSVGGYQYERPQTSTKQIKTEIAMQLGKVYIFGGFLISKTNKVNSVLPVQWKNDKQNIYLFVAIRPTVVVFNNE